MKKIILGLVQTTLSPFIIIFGSHLLQSFNMNEETMIFASVMGSISIIFNFIIGCLLIVRGYQDEGTFKGWDV